MNQNNFVRNLPDNLSGLNFNNYNYPVLNKYSTYTPNFIEPSPNRNPKINLSLPLSLLLVSAGTIILADGTIYNSISKNSTTIDTTSTNPDSCSKLNLCLNTSIYKQYLEIQNAFRFNNSIFNYNNYMELFTDNQTKAPSIKHANVTSGSYQKPQFDVVESTVEERLPEEFSNDINQQRKRNFFTGFSIGIGMQIMPEVQMKGLNKEVGVDLEVVLNKYLFLSESFVYSHIATKNIGIDFEWDISDNNSFTRTVRAETKKYNANTLHFITDLRAKTPSGKYGQLYIYTGGGIVYKGEETDGTLWDARYYTTFSYIKPISTSLYRWLPLVSLGLGWNTPLYLFKRNIGLEIRYKLLFNREKRDLPTLSDNASNAHIFSGGIRITK